MRLKLVALAITTLAAMPIQAATQCFAGPGTYGAVTVTTSGSCTITSATAFPGGMQAIEIWDDAACTYTFSKPLATSSMRIHMADIDAGESTSISTNTGAYSVIAADVSGPIPGATGGATLSASGGQVVNLSGEGSAIVSMTNSPPASITSLTLTHQGISWVGYYAVCADDSAIVAPAAIPTLSEWALIGLSSVLAMLGIARMRRRQR